MYSTGDLNIGGCLLKGIFMRKQYCFSAATEQSTACTKPHTINTPTNTQLYKQTDFSLPFFNHSCHSSGFCIFWLSFHILVIFQSIFSYNHCETNRAIRLKINSMLSHSNIYSIQPQCT